MKRIKVYLKGTFVHVRMCACFSCYLLSIKENFLRSVPKLKCWVLRAWVYLFDVLVMQ